jgi:hypothetical protein
MGIRFRGNIREVSFVDPVRIRGSGKATVSGFFPNRVNRTSDFVSGSLVLAGSNLKPEQELIRFSEHAAAGSANLIEWTSVPVWDACHGVVVLWSPAVSSVAWFSMKGERIGLERIGIPSRSTTLMDIERYLRRMARLELGPGWEAAGIDYRRLAVRYRDHFAEERPKVTDIRCESVETVWIREFDTKRDPVGRGQVWIRVSRNRGTDGFKFFDGFSPAVFSNQLIIGLIQMPDGSQALGISEGHLWP